jgi:DNA-binding NarL/FixJ family response regulator
LKAQKRDVSRVIEAEIDGIIGKEMSPSSILEQEEGRQRLLEALPDDRLRQMAQWKMEGYTNKEIAEKLGLVERSVERGIKLIREIWENYVKSAWKDSMASFQ